MSARKTKAQLAAELDAANKRIADLTDALVRAVQAHPIYVPYAVPYQPNPYPYPSPIWIGTTDIIVSAAHGDVASQVTDYIADAYNARGGQS